MKVEGLDDEYLKENGFSKKEYGSTVNLGSKHLIGELEEKALIPIRNSSDLILLNSIYKEDKESGEIIDSWYDFVVDNYINDNELWLNQNIEPSLYLESKIKNLADYPLTKKSSRIVGGEFGDTYNLDFIIFGIKGRKASDKTPYRNIFGGEHTLRPYLNGGTLWSGGVSLTWKAEPTNFERELHEKIRAREDQDKEKGPDYYGPVDEEMKSKNYPLFNLTILKSLIAETKK